jgi:hypothetical protein
MRKFPLLVSGLVLSSSSMIHADAGVNVDFECKNATTVDEVSSAYVLGNIPQLGGWNVNNAVLLGTDSEMYPTWKGTINLPRNTKVEWKCIRRIEDCPPKCGNDADWQPPPGSAGNNKFTTPSKGGLEAQVGGWPDGTPAWPAKKTSTASFVCANAYTTPGTSVYVVGNVKELGQWQPKKAVLLSNKDGAIYPTWVGTVKGLPANTIIKWKCIKRLENCSGDCNIPNENWEPPPYQNHVFKTPDSGCVSEPQTGGWPWCTKCP